MCLYFLFMSVIVPLHALTNRAFISFKFYCNFSKAQRLGTLSLPEIVKRTEKEIPGKR
jgi:hypothetical protein